MRSSLVCIIGHPIAHSRSPLIHKYWLGAHGIRGDYVREDVMPGDIEAFLDSLAESRYIGGNVTIPYKEIAFRKVAKTDAVAKALRAVNTLWIEDKKLCGVNTDVYGFLTHLDHSQPNWSTGTDTAVIIGAGGVARAAVYGLIERNIQNIVIVNRTLARAEHLAADFQQRATPDVLSDLPTLLGNADLVVNTTSLGMKGEPPLQIDLTNLKRGAIVYDLVYVPLETRLLQAARAAGFAAVDGLGMLLHQAVPAFERWFGIRPHVTSELRKLITEDLQKDAAR